MPIRKYLHRMGVVLCCGHANDLQTKAAREKQMSNGLEKYLQKREGVQEVALPQPLEKFVVNVNQQEKENVVNFPAQEKLIHQQIANMTLSGHGIHSISDVLNLPVSTVLELYDSPQCQSIFTREIKARGKYAVNAIMTSAAQDAAMTLVEVLHDRSALNLKTNELRLKAAQIILERKYGKPIAADKTKNEEDDFSDDPKLQLEQLGRELQSLEAKLTPKAIDVPKESVV